MIPWNTADLALFAVLPAALVFSALFSGSETALFGLRRRDHRKLEQHGGPAARAAAQLLAEPRKLLITLLLGNMATNITFFLVSSVLLLRMEPTALGPAGPAVASIGFLALIVIGGEVLPKIIASGAPLYWIKTTAVPVFMLHRFLRPLGHILSTVVVSPLIRLVLSSAAHSHLHETELETLLEISRESKVIDRDEEGFLTDVVNLRRQKTRDVMTPRLEISAIPAGATRAQVVRLAAKARLSNIVVYNENLDNVVGILETRAFLLSGKNTIPKKLPPPVFVPELATLDHLIETLSHAATTLAVAVDEYGQTAGVVSFDDLVGEIIGAPTADASSLATSIMTGINTWQVDGRVGVHEFAEAFGIDVEEPHYATLSGIVSDELRRVPDVGDTVILGDYQLTVREVERGTVSMLDVQAINRNEDEEE
jgi:CBS domain containing-hemolysin-like protein